MLIPASLFLAGNGLPARWAGRERFVILETAFGAGMNFLATWQAWCRDADRCRRLHFVSVEKHPLALADLQALHETEQLREEAAQLHAAWPVPTPGGHRLEFEGGRVVLTLFFGDVRLLRELSLAADAVYLDGPSPEKSPQTWTPQTLRAVSRLAARGATLAAPTAPPELRRALEQTGFAWETRPGFGAGGEMLVARNEKQGQTPFSAPERKAAVIGAGLAGAAICERLCARGWEVDLYERHAGPAQEASGNLAGAFHPIVTPDDSLFARMTRAGFLFAVQRMDFFENARWDPCGVLQLARDERELDSQRRAAALFPPEYVQLVEREQAAGHAGVPVSGPGLWFPAGGWIQPQSLVEAQLAACGARLTRSFSSERTQVPEAPIVILANGFDAPKLHPVPHLRLRRVRGQLTYVPADALEPPHAVVLRGGMVLPPVDGRCVVGASFDIDDDDPGPRRESDEGNLQRLERILGQRVEIQEAESRVAFRAVAPDRMPVVGHLGGNVYGAFAYGSRGLVWSWIAAELLASMVEGDPLPLEAPLVGALDPARFRRRAESRGSPR